MDVEGRSRLWTALPPLVWLLVYWPGLFAWFQQDDFSWLNLEAGWRAVVEPKAQGSVRFLSERLFYLGFRGLFGLNAFPYRLAVFLTQLANLLLLGAVARRLTGSRAGGGIATLVWGVNIALLIPMAQTAAYNQVLCAFFFLASFWLFLRHLETGRWSWYGWQCAAFALGFGALESMVVYPAVLLLYCLLLARAHAWKALPLAAAAGLYAAVLLRAVPAAGAGPYARHWDWSILVTLGQYWTWALGRTPLPLALLLSAGLAAAVALAGAGRRRAAWFAAWFGLGWFLLALAPFLPLRDHAFDHYLTIPAIGLALAVASAARAAPRWTAAVWLLIYGGASVEFVRREMPPRVERSHAARRFLEGVREIRAVHPDKTILITGVDDSLFYGVIYTEGLRAAGIRRAYLAPDNQALAQGAGLESPDNYRLPARAALAALRSREAVVYRHTAGRLENITAAYAATAPSLLEDAPPRRVDAGEPLLAPQLGAGWYPIQGSHRWMGRRAELRLAAPDAPGHSLRVEAIHSEHPAAGPVRLSVSANGLPIGSAVIRDNRSGRHVFPLPAEVVGRGEMVVALAVDRTFRVPGGDGRDLGLAFGVVELLSTVQ